MRSPKRIFDDATPTSKDRTEIPKPQSPDGFEVARSQSSRSKRRGRPEGVGYRARLLIGTLLAITALVVGVLVALRPLPASYRLSNWTSARVSAAQFVETASGGGVLVSARTLSIKARLDGRVTGILVTEGQTVNQGTLLVRLASREVGDAVRLASIAVQASKKRLRQAAKNVENAQRSGQLSVDAAVAKLESETKKLAQLRELLAIGGETRNNVELGEASVEAARRNVEQARLEAEKLVSEANVSLDQARLEVRRNEATLGSALEQSAQTKLFAPFTGQVTEIKVVEGQTVAQGDSLLTLVDPTIRQAQIDVQATKADRLRVGQPVTLMIGSQRTSGTVRAIGAQATGNSSRDSTVRLEVNLANKITGFRPNTQVTAEVELARRNGVLSVARGPFLATGGSEFVFVISSDGTKAVRRNVRFGDSSDNRVEILDGLELGERIITSSYNAFKEFTEIELSKTGELK